MVSLHICARNSFDDCNDNDENHGSENTATFLKTRESTSWSASLFFFPFLLLLVVVVLLLPHLCLVTIVCDIVCERASPTPWNNECYRNISYTSAGCIHLQ